MLRGALLNARDDLPADDAHMEADDNPQLLPVDTASSIVELRDRLRDRFMLRTGGRTYLDEDSVSFVAELFAAFEA